MSSHGKKSAVFRAWRATEKPLQLGTRNEINVPLLIFFETPMGVALPPLISHNVLLPFNQLILANRISQTSRPRFSVTAD